MVEQWHDQPPIQLDFAGFQQRRPSLQCQVGCDSRGERFLATLDALTSLSLRYTRITDAGLTAKGRYNRGRSARLWSPGVSPLLATKSHIPGPDHRSRVPGVHEFVGRYGYALQV